MLSRGTPVRIKTYQGSVNYPAGQTGIVSKQLDSGMYDVILDNPRSVNERRWICREEELEVLRYG